MHFRRFGGAYHKHQASDVTNDATARSVPRKVLSLKLHPGTDDCAPNGVRDLVKELKTLQ